MKMTTMQKIDSLPSYYSDTLFLFPLSRFPRAINSLGNIAIAIIFAFLLALLVMVAFLILILHLRSHWQSIISFPHFNSPL